MCILHNYFCNISYLAKINTEKYSWKAGIGLRLLLNNMEMLIPIK